MSRYLLLVGGSGNLGKAVVHSFKDSWNYEPMSQWHLDWQDKFTNAQREAYIQKDGVIHRADILTNSNVVIEVQNSAISQHDIWEREVFYDKLIWVINGYRFKSNLLFKHDIFRRSKFFLNKYWEIDKVDGEYCLIIDVPYYDEYGNLLATLKENQFTYWQDKKWIKRNEKYLDNDIIRALYSVDMDISINSYYREYRKIEVKYRPGIVFTWKRFHKCWIDVLSDNCQLFIDLNNGFLLMIIDLYKEGKGYGRFIPKEQFIKKYNKPKVS